MKIYYFRHGKSNYEKDCLTDEGKQEALILGNNIKNIKFDKIYVSPANRAIETAEIALNCNKSIFNVIDFASESYAWRNFSINYNKRLYWLFYRDDLSELIKNLKTKTDWYNHKVFSSLPIKESLDWYDKEIEKWLNLIGFKRDNNTKKYYFIEHRYSKVAIFAHSGFGLIFLANLLNITIPNACSCYAEMRTCSCNIFDIDEKTGNIEIENYDLK